MDKVAAAFTYKYDIIIVTERGVVYRLRISDLTDQLTLQKIQDLNLYS